MTILEFYDYLNWKIIQLDKNSKKPFAESWPKIDIKYASNILNLGYNIGIETGKVSNITVIDFDTKPINVDFVSELNETLVQETTKGYHYVYQYEPEFKTSRFQSIGLDIRNDGGQICVSPSKIDNIGRRWLKYCKPQKMSEKLKNLLLQKTNTKTVIDDKITDFDIKPLQAGEGRREYVLKSGGFLRNHLNSTQLQLVMNFINQAFFEPKLNNSEMLKIMKYLNQYASYDNVEFLNRILEQFKYMKSLSSLTLKDILKEDREKIERALALLVEQKKIVKRQNYFILYSDVDWSDKFEAESNKLNFKVPFLNDWNIYRNGDMIVLGAPTGNGKTHIAMNIVRQLVDQGIKPYYMSTESGSRYVTIAQSLGLKDGDFYKFSSSNPLETPLKQDAVTIIDWLEQGEFKNTNQIFKILHDQLISKGGLLFVFVQLKKTYQKEGQESYSFYAENLINFYAAVSGMFIYDNVDRDRSHFECRKAREYDGAGVPANINCKYDWRTKKLEVIGELEEIEENI